MPVTQTEWDDPAFRALTDADKCLLQYIRDRCDHAGFWQIEAVLTTAFLSNAAHKWSERDLHESLGRVLTYLGATVEHTDQWVWLLPQRTRKDGSWRHLEESWYGKSLRRALESHIDDSPNVARLLNGEDPLPRETQDEMALDVHVPQASRPRTQSRKAQSAKDERFEQAWADFGRYGVKKKALEYWRQYTRKEQDAIVAAIPEYMRCVAQGRRQSQFEGWINPRNRKWDNNWRAARRAWSGGPPMATASDEARNRRVMEYLGEERRA